MPSPKTEKVSETIEPSSFVAFKEAYLNSATIDSTATKSRLPAQGFRKQLTSLMEKIG